jgi:hypothetical protein
MIPARLRIPAGLKHLAGKPKKPDEHFAEARGEHQGESAETAPRGPGRSANGTAPG